MKHGVWASFPGGLSCHSAHEAVTVALGRDTSVTVRSWSLPLLSAHSRAPVWRPGPSCVSREWSSSKEAEQPASRASEETRPHHWLRPGLQSKSVKSRRRVRQSREELSLSGLLDMGCAVGCQFQGLSQLIVRLRKRLLVLELRPSQPLSCLPPPCPSGADTAAGTPFCSQVPPLLVTWP